MKNLVAFFALAILPCPAQTTNATPAAPATETWTVNGKTYLEVQVIKVQPDAVTILDADGGARLALSSLPPDLQKRFNYVPAGPKSIAVSAQNTSPTVNIDTAPIREKPEWKQRLKELSSTLESIKKEGGTFVTTKGSTYSWNDITEVTPVGLSYMTEHGAGTLPIALLPPEAMKRLTLTPDDINKWNADENQRNLVIYQNNQKLLEIKKTKIAQEAAAQALIAQQIAEDAADHSEAKKRALEATESQADRVKTLGDELDDLDTQIFHPGDMGSLAPGVTGGGPPTDDQIANAAAYRALKSQYDLKKIRYSDAKANYEKSLRDAEDRFYAQIRGNKRSATPPSAGQMVSVTLANGTAKAGKLEMLDHEGIWLSTEAGKERILFTEMTPVDRAYFGFAFRQ